MNARRQILLVQMEVHHCTASMNAIPGSHTQLRSFPCPPPHVHLYQAIGHLLHLIGTILPVVQSLLSSLCTDKLTPTSAPTLLHVAVARGRALCPECHGENDDMFHFCQWCATPSTCYSISTEGACLSIDDPALGARYTQFTTSLENKTSMVRREAVKTLLG